MLDSYSKSIRITFGLTLFAHAQWLRSLPRYTEQLLALKTITMVGLSEVMRVFVVILISFVALQHNLTLLHRVQSNIALCRRAPPPIHWRGNNKHACDRRLLPRSAGKHYIVLLSLLYLHETIMLWINRAGYSRTTHRDTARFLANWIRIESSSVVADICQSDPRVVADFFQTRRRKYLIKTYPDSCSLGLRRVVKRATVGEKMREK